MSSRIDREFRMQEEIGVLYQDLNAFFRENRERIEAEVKQFKLQAAQNHVRYAGRALLIAFYPFVLSEAQARNVSEAVEAMLRLMEKTTRLFLDEPAVRQAFGFRPEQIELIEVEPGYEPAIPFARLDSFFDGRSLRFSEINTDGTSGMDGADKVAKLFLAAPTMREFFAARPVGTFEINHCVLQTLLRCHGQFVGGRAAGPSRIAIVDWKEARTFEEFVAFAEFCRANGHKAVVADPRELDYDGHTLSHRGLKIDIVYRRVVSREYIERLKEVRAMTHAYTDHNVCVVGSFRSDVAFNKKTFGVLHNPEFARFFTEKERELVEKYVPWTRAFDGSECEYRGRKVNMLDLAKSEKDMFVLKPSDLYEGRGVKLGAQTSREDWEKAAEAALESDCVLQELIPIPSMPIGVWNDEFEMETRLIHLGEYVFDGTFCGFYCRAADVPIINASSKELLVPCLVLKR